MNKLLLTVAASAAFAVTAQASLVFSQSFTGGTDSWTMAGGGTMTTQTLTGAFLTTDSSLNFLIAKPAGDTDAASGSISAWVNLPSATAANLFTVRSTGTTSDISNFGGYSLSTNTSAIASLNQTGNSTGALATAPITDWSLLTLTVQKQVGFRLMDVSLYINGQLWGGQTAPVDTVAGTNLNGTAFTGLVVGQAGVSVGGLQVYDTVLTGTEVANLYSAQVAAIPEPSTYGLMGAGALAAVAFVRRRKRSA